MTPLVPAPARPARWIIVLSIALLCLIWGSTWIVIQAGLAQLPPYTSAAARFAIAALVMTALVPLIGRRESGVRPPLYLWTTLGLLSFAASYAIVYRTETLLPSGLVSLLWAVFPMLMAVAAHFYLPGERLHRAQWLGFTLGLGGFVLLFATDLVAIAPGAIPAALVLFLSPLVSAVATTLVKRHGAGVNSLALNRNAMALGAAVLAALAFATEDVAGVKWSSRSIASVLYLALAGTVFTFGVYFWLMRYVHAHKLSLIAYVTPLVALALGWLNGEPVTWSTVSGAICILGGVALVVSAKTKTPDAREPGSSLAAEDDLRATPR